MKVSTRPVIDHLASSPRRRQMVEDGIGLGTWVTLEVSGRLVTAQVWAVEVGGKRPRFILADGTRFHYVTPGDCTVLGQAQDVPLVTDAVA